MFIVYIQPGDVCASAGTAVANTSNSDATGEARREEVRMGSWTGVEFACGRNDAGCQHMIDGHDLHYPMTILGRRAPQSMVAAPTGPVAVPYMPTATPVV